jgi:hypothetical protein
MRSAPYGLAKRELAIQFHPRACKALAVASAFFSAIYLVAALWCSYWSDKLTTSSSDEGAIAMVLFLGRGIAIVLFAVLPVLMLITYNNPKYWVIRAGDGGKT